MGLAKAAAKLLVAEALRRPLCGEVLTLGKQDIWFTKDTLAEIAEQYGLELRPVEYQLSSKPEFAEKGFIDDVSFLRAIGFDGVCSLDVSDFEGADIIHDLNEREIPSNLQNRFDVVIDGGTFEHVFHIPNALLGTIQMVKKGGRIVHFSPASNFLDHGFYMFAPTLFWDFYVTNQFKINTAYVVRLAVRHDIDPWEIFEYDSRRIRSITFGGLDNAPYAVFFIVTKQSASTDLRIPNQGVFLEAWGERSDNLPVADAQQSFPQEERNVRAKAWLRKFPWLYRMCSKCYWEWRWCRRKDPSRRLPLKYLGRL